MRFPDSQVVLSLHNKYKTKCSVVCLHSSEVPLASHMPFRWTLLKVMFAETLRGRSVAIFCSKRHRHINLGLYYLSSAVTAVNSPIVENAILKDSDLIPNCPIMLIEVAFKSIYCRLSWFYKSLWFWIQGEMEGQVSLKVSTSDLPWSNQIKSMIS